MKDVIGESELEDTPKIDNLFHADPLSQICCDNNSYCELFPVRHRNTQTIY